MLTIDIGNSRIKWAIITGGQVRGSDAIAYNNENFETVLDGAQFHDAMESVEISCVANSEIKNRFIGWLNLHAYKNFRFAETKAEQCNIVNSYEIPANMGVDRWMAMIAAYKLCVDKGAGRVCVIDCGTAITVDILDEQGRHLGGVILPGLQTMIRSLVRDTGNINNSEKTIYKAPLSFSLASSTEDALINGCSQLVVEGLSGILARYNSGGKMHCIVTGGDGQWVSDALSFESIYNPDLVLLGLSMASSDANK